MTDKKVMRHTPECIARAKSGRGGCWCHLPEVQKRLKELNR